MKIVKLGEVVDLFNGSTPLKTNKNYWTNGDVPWFTVDDLRKQGKYITYTEKFITKLGLKESSISLIPENAILLCCTASVGAIAINKIRLTTNQQFNALVVKNTDQLLVEYLYYWFLANMDTLKSLGRATTIDYVSMSKLKDMDIQLPSLDKQHEVAEKLDSAFAEIDSVERNLRHSDEKANQLLQSILSTSLNNSVIGSESSNPPVNQTVDFKLVKLSEVCLFNPPKSEARSALNSDDLVSFMPMQDLGIQSINAEASTSKPLNEVLNAYTYFAENDILIAKITPCFENGKMGIARNLVNGVGFGSSEYFVIRPADYILSEYLYYFLRQEFVIENGRGIMTGAVGHRRVPGEYLENLEIPLPSLEKQQEIFRKLDSAFNEIEILKAQINIKKDYATALRQSLLSSAFTQKELVV